VFTQVAAGWCLFDDGRKYRPKYVEPTWNNKLTYIVHLVGYFHSCITTHGFMKVKCFTKLSGCDLFQSPVEIFACTDLAEARNSSRVEATFAMKIGPGIFRASKWVTNH